MSLRVVLYAEGGNETRSELGLPPAPGEPLLEDDLGPAHLLVRRCLADARRIPENAVRFEAPKRTARGRIAVGAELYDRRVTLRQLLVWPMTPKQPARPELAVVLVDCDAEPGRKQKLEGWVSDLPGTRIIAVAIQEFEAWLIADTVALNKALGAGPSTAPDPESMKPRQAKELLASWVGAQSRTDRDIRRTLAEICDLDVVAKRCSAFGEFRKELGRS